MKSFHCSLTPNSMKKTAYVKKPYAVKKVIKKPYKKNDANALQVCKVNGTCPVPDVYRCQFRYGGYDSISMSAGSLYTGQYIYAANSLYDPLVSGGGTQPYYYDQLVAPSSGTTGLFKAWKVSGCKIDFEFCSAGPNTVPVYVWLLPISSDNSSLPTLPPNLDEYPRSKRVTLTPGGGSQTAQKITNYLPIHTHENITWNDWNANDYDYQGAYNLNPQKTCYWYVIAKPADGSTTSMIFMKTSITYYAELSERNQELDYS